MSCTVPGFVNRYLFVPFFRDPVTNADQFLDLETRPPIFHFVRTRPTQIMSTAQVAPQFPLRQFSDKNGDTPT
jgi:hypothetical protein